MICLATKAYTLSAIIKVSYLFTNDLEKTNCILFLTAFYRVRMLWIKSRCLYVFEWHRTKFDRYSWSNKIKFYWTYFGNKMCMINFNCAKALALAFALKYVCAKFSHSHWISLLFFFCFAFISFSNNRLFNSFHNKCMSLCLKLPYAGKVCWSIIGYLIFV